MLGDEEGAGRLAGLALLNVTFGSEFNFGQLDCFDKPGWSLSFWYWIHRLFLHCPLIKSSKLLSTFLIVETLRDGLLNAEDDISVNSNEPRFEVLAQLCEWEWEEYYPSFHPTIPSLPKMRLNHKSLQLLSKFYPFFAPQMIYSGSKIPSIEQ